MKVLITHQSKDKVSPLQFDNFTSCWKIIVSTEQKEKTHAKKSHFRDFEFARLVLEKNPIFIVSQYSTINSMFVTENTITSPCLSYMQLTLIYNWYRFCKKIKSLIKKYHLFNFQWATTIKMINNNNNKIPNLWILL